MQKMDTSVDRRMITPQPLSSTIQLKVPLNGATAKVMMRLFDPEIILFGNVFSSDECDAVVKHLRPRLTRSHVFDNVTGDNVQDAARTSRGSTYTRGESNIIDSLDSRLAQLANWPLEKSETFQFLEYAKDEYYVPHYDFFHPGQPGTTAKYSQCGNRVATMIVYLTEPEEGGVTFFPDLSLQIMPVKGSALFFSYERPNSNTKTLHAGEPVVSGTKCIVTKWFRESIF